MKVIGWLTGTSELILDSGLVVAFLEECRSAPVSSSVTVVGENRAEKAGRGEDEGNGGELHVDG